MEKTNECKMLGMMGDDGFEKVRRVYSTDALVPAISTKEDRIKILTDKHIVAMRGRNPERPTDRTAGLHTEQRLEPAPKGVDNTLTTVQKDNLVLECDFYKQAVETAEKENAQPGDVIDAFNGKVRKDGICPTITTRPEGKKTAILPCVEIKQATKEGSIKCKVGGCYDASYPDSKTRRGRVQEGGDVTPTLTASNSENIHYVETEYRIRKLTPKECWRLMGYTDEDYEKAAAVNSNTQLYKQAGNAIVKQVLMAIFRQMIPENCRQK